MVDSKRQIVYGAVLPILLGACSTFNVYDQEVDENRYSELIQTLESLCEDTAYIILGDSDHTAPEITEVIADPYVLQAIKNCDRPFFREAGMEQNEGYKEGASRPQRFRTQRMIYQDYQDGYETFKGIEYTGKGLFHLGGYAASTDEQKNRHNNLKTIYNAALLDIPLLYPDVRHATFNEAESDTLEWFYEQRYNYNPQTPQDDINFKIALDANFNANIEVRPYGVNERYLVENADSEEINQAIVTNIRGLSDNGPAILDYGLGHMLQGNDFDEMLGEEQTATILLKAFPDKILWGSNIVDDPEYIYDIRNNVMVEVDKDDPGNAFRQMVRQGYTQEEYQIAIDILPVDLKAFALPFSEYNGTTEDDQLPEDWLETDIIYSFGNDPEI